MGEVIGGRYRVEAELGQGGMGAVYWAVDEASGDPIALKRMLDPRRSRRAELRFQREFHTLASLRHPRVVEVYDYGVDEVGPYYTMELLEGDDLRDIMAAEGSLEPARVCALLRDVASALALLHARGLVHRDLSPRNIRVVDGRAKLFDFGVLVNAGWVGDVAGTPAYVAPEMVRGMPIDGRADLFSLGVLAYAMLTGARPYDARSMVELESAWERPVVPPSAHAPVPEALEDLVLDLLSLEPLARPPSAAVLIDRLTALGDLAPDPELRVAPGYVESAAMVGRDAELAELGGLVEEVRLTEGRAFYLEAESGAGKSRLLAEVALRSKLAGLTVAEVSCETAEGGPYAALTTLLEALFVRAPEDATLASRDEAPALGRVFARVREAHPTARPRPESGEPAEDRMRLHAAVNRFVTDLAARRPIALFVDDVQRCDEASAAALASLARARPHGLLLGFTRRLGEPVRAPMAIGALGDLSPKLRLAGLSTQGVEALLRSVFGDVAHLGRLARWMSERTGGSPLFCTELAKSLIDEEVIRYADGAWIVPDDVGLRELPDGLAAAMRRRVAGLGDAARALGERLAVHGGELSLDRVLALAEADREGDGGPGAAGPEAVFAALGELSREGIFLDHGDRLRFRHDSLREALLAGIDPERRRGLHRHVGEVMERAGVADDATALAEVGWHLARGGDEARGAQMLERAGRDLYAAQALADCVAPLEVALEARQRQGAPPAVIADLTHMLLGAGWVSNREVGARHAETPVDLYADMAGLKDAARWRRWLGWRVAFLFALAWAFARWAFRFGEARGPHPIRALSFFALDLSYATALAYAANQRAVVASFIERAEPFRAFEGQPPYAAYLTLVGMTDILEGRLHDASRRLTEARRIATRRHLNPLTPAERVLVDAGCRSIRAIVDVNQFEPRLFDDLDAMDRCGLAYYAHTADSIRIVRHRYRGEEQRARALEEAIEGTSIALGSWSTDLQRLLFAHPAYAFCHDIAGLKRSLDALERRVAEGMELGTRVTITRAEILRERGEPEAALELLEPLLASLDPADNLFAQHAGCAAAQAALEAYDYDAAIRLARQCVQRGADPKLRVLLPWLRASRVLALADDALGRTEAAVERLEEAIAIAEERDCPVMAGELHEARARVAFASQDRLLFELHRAEAARWLRPTENPGLLKIAERLYELDREGEAREIDVRRRRPGPTSTETSAERSVSKSDEPQATVIEHPSRRPPRRSSQDEQTVPASAPPPRPEERTVPSRPVSSRRGRDD